MASKNKKEVWKLLLGFVAVLVTILLFTLGDYYFHQLEDGYSVPARYFSNKIIYGTIFGLIAFYLLRKINKGDRVILFSSIVTLALEIRYIFEGYPINFLLVFLLVHFAILVLVSRIIFQLHDLIS